jgi:hypothetical protein
MGPCTVVCAVVSTVQSISPSQECTCGRRTLQEQFGLRAGETTVELLQPVHVRRDGQLQAVPGPCGRPRVLGGAQAGGNDQVLDVDG